MANTATIAAPTNRRAPSAGAAPILPPPPVEVPDWPSRQRLILREAPDAETAIRWQLAASLEHLTFLEAQLAALAARILAVPPVPGPMRAAHWRPQILTLLRERGAPMAPAAITQALDAPRSLAEICRDMATAGLLLRTDGHYALPPDGVSGSGSLVSGLQPGTRNQEPGTRGGTTNHPGAAGGRRRRRRKPAGW